MMYNWTSSVSYTHLDVYKRQKRFSFLQSVALVVLGLVLFVNLIMFMLPDRKKRDRKKR